MACNVTAQGLLGACGCYQAANQYTIAGIVAVLRLNGVRTMDNPVGFGALPAFANGRLWRVWSIRHVGFGIGGNTVADGTITYSATRRTDGARTTQATGTFPTIMGEDDIQSLTRRGYFYPLDACAYSTADTELVYRRCYTGSWIPGSVMGFLEFTALTEYTPQEWRADLDQLFIDSGLDLNAMAYGTARLVDYRNDGTIENLDIFAGGNTNWYSQRCLGGSINQYNLVDSGIIFHNDLGAGGYPTGHWNPVITGIKKKFKFMDSRGQLASANYAMRTYSRTIGWLQSNWNDPQDDCGSVTCVDGNGSEVILSDVSQWEVFRTLTPFQTCNLAP